MGAVSTGAATLTWTRAGREPTGWDPSYSLWRPGSPRPLRSNLGVPIGGGGITIWGADSCPSSPQTATSRAGPRGEAASVSPAYSSEHRARAVNTATSMGVPCAAQGGAGRSWRGRGSYRCR